MPTYTDFLADWPSLMDTFSDTRVLDRMGAVVDRPLCLLSACHALGHSVWHFRQQFRLVSSYQTNGRRDRWQKDLASDLTTMYTYCELQDTAPEIRFTLEFLMISLHVSLEDVQTFSGKSGEDEARKVFPHIRDWTQRPESRDAVWHAGQVLRIARQFEKTRLRDFYAVAVYHSTLTLFVYGVVTSNVARKSGMQTPAFPSTPRMNDPYSMQASTSHMILVDGDDARAAKAFTLLGERTPGIQSLSSSCVPLSDSKALMSAAEGVLKNNFPLSRNGLPPLVENLANLMNELGKLPGRD